MDLGVQRVTSLELKNFRGFRSEKSLDTDADVVVITGPNGFGKTSVIDALCLLLNGYSYPPDEAMIFNGEERALIRANLVCQEGNEVQEIVLEKGEKPKPSNPGLWPRIPNEMAARASFFYQDLVEKLFDEGEPETMLAEFLAPLSRKTSQIRQELKRTLRDWPKKKMALISTEDFEQRRRSIDEDRGKLWQSFLQSWSIISSWLPGQELPSFEQVKVTRQRWLEDLRPKVDRLGTFCHKEYQKIPAGATSVTILGQLKVTVRALGDYLEREYQKWNEKRTRIMQKQDAWQKLLQLAAQLAGEELLDANRIVEERRNLQVLTNEQSRVEATLGKLKSLTTYFESETNRELPGLDKILRSLRSNAEKWSRIELPVGVNLQPPMEVIRWLHQARESFFVGNQGMDEHLQRWQRELKARAADLERTIGELRAQIQRITRMIQVSDGIERIVAQWPEFAEYVTDKNKFVQLQNEYRQEQGRQEPTHPFDRISEIEIRNRIGQLLSILSKWIELEGRAQQLEAEKQRRNESIKEANNLLCEIEDALKKEASDQDSSLYSISERMNTLPEDIREDFTRVVGQVFSRFRLVPGLHPVQFKSEEKKQSDSRNTTFMWKVTAADGRTLHMLSTGQKAQLALALMLALNIVIRDKMPHNIIALDDTTTALDLAQLPREAALIRQFAYGTGVVTAQIGYHRRQVFIVSHHEELTHRLIDFLYPPEGRSMRILNFVNWDNKTGPVVEEMVVSPALTAEGSNRKSFGEFLTSILISSI